MSVKKSKKQIIQKNTPKVTMLFDNALPTTLKNIGITKVTDTKVNLHTDSKSASVSPYVIRLTRDQETEVKTSPELKLQELAEQLMFEEDFETVDKPQSVADLSLDKKAFAQQMREPDVHLTKRFLKTGKITIEDAYTQPVALSNLPGDRIDIEQLSETEADEVIIVNSSPEPKIRVKKSITLSDWLPSFNFPLLRSCRLHVLIPQQARHRAIASFLALSFVLVLPIQAMQGLADTQNRQVIISDSGKSALENLMSGLSAIEADRFTVASSDFNRASQRFAEAEESLTGMHMTVATLVSIIPQTDRTYDSVNGLISAGKELSTTASLIADAANKVANSNSVDVVTKLEIMQTYVNQALPHIDSAVSSLEKVNLNIIPVDQQNLVNQLLEKTPQLANSMQEFLTFSDALIMMLGGNEKMRYLVAFQNNTELRATGGFTGSFAEMDFLNGDIANIHIPEGGTYDLQGQLSEYVSAPEPLQLINPRWEFHDANWFPDFPSSAEKMLWFYENAGGPTTDGLIAFNATLIPDLLALTGPIEMPEYGRTIDSENFLFETQKIVELEYAQYQADTDREEEAPKQFIGDLAPKLLASLEDADIPTLLAAVDLIGSALTQKDILLYFSDNELQSKIEELGWSGSIKQTSGDYLMVVNSNLGGGKTDTVISQMIDVDVEIQETGEVINTVTITKEHHGINTSLFQGSNNVDYIRLYVPEGSELIDASGFEIPPDYLFEDADIDLYQDQDLALMMSGFNTDFSTGTDIWEESGKTVFGNWMQTAPGETEVVTFTYKLPISFAPTESDNNLFSTAKARLGLRDLETYSLLVQKQPGVETRTTNIRIETPNSIDIVWSSDEDLNSTGSEINNEYDQVFQLLLETTN